MRITSLQLLNLENCYLGDLNTIKVCKSLKRQMALNTIILDRNSITNISCKSIEKMIKNVYTLKHVSLYWNTIQYMNKKGGRGIAHTTGCARELWNEGAEFRME